MIFKQLYLPALSIFLLCACTSPGKLSYLNGAKETTTYGVGKGDDVRIAPNDILSINISSLSAEASSIFNPDKESLSKTTTLTGSHVERGGYLVNPEGNIQLPVLGYMQAAGMTKEELKNRITKELLDKKLLKDPLVEIRFLNYEVTVLGEVSAPTVITVPSEKISLLKALGLAGDLTIYGRRDNVLLIREEGSRRTTHKIDLTDAEFLSSPYYYLQPNDIVYVQPNKARAAQSGMWPQFVPILLAAFSLAVIVLDRVLR